MPAPYVSIQDPQNPTEIARVIDGLLAVAQVGLGSALVEDSRSWIATIQRATIADAGVVELLVLTGATDVLKGSFSVSASAECNIEFFEEPTINANGTPLTLVSRNRDNPGASPSAQMFTAPTLGGDGTSLTAIYLPGGDKNNAVGVTGDITGWVLKKSSSYLIRITNTSGAPAEIAALVPFVEVEPEA